MTKLVAIHSIDRGSKANPSKVAPGKSWDATAKEVEVLLPLRAAREATAQDIALEDAHNAKAAPKAAEPVVQVDPVVTGPSDREILEAKATELGVKFSANIGDEGLAKRINEAERKALEARAKKVSVTFDKDTTDADLEAAVVEAEKVAGTDDLV